MATFRLKVSDTITYYRECVVEITAETIEAAKEAALKRASDGDYNDHWIEEEIDNTNYEVEEATEYGYI